MKWEMRVWVYVCVCLRVHACVFLGSEIMFKIIHFKKHCQSNGKMTDVFVPLADGLDVDFVSDKLFGLDVYILLLEGD